MSTKETGGAAFPTGAGVTPYNPGMTLRDYFSAKVIPAMCVGRSYGDVKGHVVVSAKLAYLIADAMLEARKS